VCGRGSENQTDREKQWKASGSGISKASKIHGSVVGGRVIKQLALLKKICGGDVGMGPVKQAGKNLRKKKKSRKKNAS